MGAPGWLDGRRTLAPPAGAAAFQASTDQHLGGVWFSSGDVLAVWSGQSGPPGAADRCPVCDTADGALQAIAASTWSE